MGIGASKETKKRPRGYPVFCCVKIHNGSGETHSELLIGDRSVESSGQLLVKEVVLKNSIEN